MRRRLTLVAVVTALTVFPQLMVGQELLTNPSLELVPPDRGGRYTVAPGWTTLEGPAVAGIPNPADSEEDADYNDNGIVDAADYVLWRDGGPLLNEAPNATPGLVTQEDYDAWKARFGNGVLSLSEPSDFVHLLFDGDWQHWFQPFNGTEAEQEENFAHLFQDVPGTPGMMYTMTGHALFEDFFPGGVDNLNLEVSGTPTGAPFDDGPASPTDAFFALEFLDAANAVLPGSVEIELKAAGQLSNTMWQQHTLNAVAPAGTTSVRVRASMIDGVFNPLPSPQVFQMSFFVDAFSLTAMPGPGTGAGVVPEPATLLLTATALGAMGALSRRSRSHGNE